MRYLFILLLCSGCATRGTAIDANVSPPADWPTLQVNVINAGKGNLGPYCGLSRDGANGCALVNFAIRTCSIFVTTDDPAVMQHERMHCAGYDHVGDSAMRDAWERYKAIHGTAALRTSAPLEPSPAPR